MKLHSDVIRRYTSLSGVVDILRRQQLPLLNPESWDDRNDRYFMDLYKEARQLGGLYALCAAQCAETYHHWKVFTGGAEGACLEIRREPFEALLSQLQHVRFKTVDYLVLEKVDRLRPQDLANLPFCKRYGFTDEIEYRVIAETAEPQQPVLRIDFPLELIGRIELSPWLPDAVAESVQAVLSSITADHAIEIRRSRLIDNDRWKRAGDRVVGKKARAVHLKPSSPRKAGK